MLSAIELEYNGDILASIDYLDRAIEDFPEYGFAYYRRGTLNNEIGRFIQALADFNMAEELGQENPYLYLGRGIAYARLDEYDKALLDFEIVEDLDRFNPDLYYNRGIVYGLQG